MNKQFHFGMREMEEAAKVVEAKGCSVRLADFTTDETRIGFLHLIEGGFLERWLYNGSFVPNHSFRERRIQAPATAIPASYSDDSHP